MNLSQATRLCARVSIVVSLLSAGLAFALGDWQQGLWAVSAAGWAWMFLMATRQSDPIITICVSADVQGVDPAVRRRRA